MANSLKDHLAVYLNDHLAGATAALQLLDHLQKHEDPALQQFTAELRQDIAEDRDELMRLLRSAGVAISSVRAGAGWIGGKAAELKLAIDDSTSGGLWTFELLEVLALGIEGKRALWAVLRSLSGAVPALRVADYERLAGRADYQRRAVEAKRLEWAATAFAAREPASHVKD
jgi:sugar phosphate isomerase/epimerase